MEIFLALIASALIIWGIGIYLKGPDSKTSTKKDSSVTDNQSQTQQALHHLSNSLSTSKKIITRTDTTLRSEITTESKIQQAIRMQRDLTFQYIDKSGEITSRRITPKEIKPYYFETGTGSTICVEAYCHLRKEPRVFAIKRMSEIVFL